MVITISRSNNIPECVLSSRSRVFSDIVEENREYLVNNFSSRNKEGNKIYVYPSALFEMMQRISNVVCNDMQLECIFEVE